MTLPPTRQLARPRTISAYLHARAAPPVRFQRRWNSSPQPTSTAGDEAKRASPTAEFYKTFTRPVAKVLLMATFVYQLAYWAWVRLEKDEIKRERNAEIERLEEQLKDLTTKKMP